MGLGLNGGGEAAVRFFLHKGAYVTVTDMKTEDKLKPTIERLNSDKSLNLSRLTYRLGEHRIEDFQNADCVIKNPGVKYNGNIYLAAAKAIETDLSIFLRFTKCPIIAVTGSKGKSSTVSAIYYGLKEAGFNAFLGGNITVSPLTFFDQVTDDSPVVIEFSSWQLADLRGRKVLKPHISIITKIVPDHQNWYGNMEDYVADKRLIYANQDKNDFSIFDSGADEPGTGPSQELHPGAKTWGDLFATESKATVLRYGENAVNPSLSKVELGKLLVPGEHMRINAQNAAMVMQLMGVENEKIKQILESWTGIAHRLQYFHNWKNYKFYNDSAATVPEAAAAATKAFDKPVILLTGGTDKGLSLAPLAETLATKNTKDIYLLDGTATQKLIPDLNKNNVSYYGPFASLQEMISELKNNLEKEVQVKKENPAENIVVFSPGATSFGMFNNEFDRGDKFIQTIKDCFQ